MQNEGQQRVGYRQRIARPRRRTRFDQCPRQLERKQRIAARDLGDAPQRRPRKDVVEVRADDVVQRTEAERAEMDPLDSPGERTVQPERIAGTLILNAQRGDDTDAPIADPSQRECERLRRRAVEPLLIVDRQHHRRRGGEQAQQRQHRHRDGARARRRAVRARAHQRDLERPPLRLGELRQNRVNDRLEKVGERRERQLRFGLHGPTRQHDQRAARGPLEDLPPHRGLADPHLALEDDRSGLVPEPIEEAVDRVELGAAADDGLHVRRKTSGAIARNISRKSEQYPSSRPRTHFNRVVSVGGTEGSRTPSLLRQLDEPFAPHHELTQRTNFGNPPASARVSKSGRPRSSTAAKPAPSRCGTG